MADDTPSPASENVTVQPEPPAVAPTNGAIQEAEPAPPAPKRPPAPPEPDGIDPAFKRSRLQRAGGWLVAFLLFGLVACAVFFFVVGPLMVAFGIPAAGARLGAIITFLLTYTLFYKLDENLWLSEQLGLKTGPKSSPLRRTLFALVPFVGSASQPKSATGADKDQAAPRPHDTYREVVETVVFVVVLVLMLKTFIAEAFVIPTGSMASTLWGYQKVTTCPKCGHTFPVNCSKEVDPQSDSPGVVIGCTCPNCRLNIDYANTDEGPIIRISGDSDPLLLLESSSDKDPMLRGEYVIDSQNQPVPYNREQHQKEVPQNRPFPARVCKLTQESKILLDGQKIDREALQKKLSMRQAGETILGRVCYQLADKNSPVPVLELDVSTAGKFAQAFVPELPGNCIMNPPAHSGDRVLVAKFLYDSGLRPPHRHDVVVFKYPETPQKNYAALNYIKRLIGLSGETIGIHGGKLYVANNIEYANTDPADLRQADVRKPEYMKTNEAVDKFKADLLARRSSPTTQVVLLHSFPVAVVQLAPVPVAVAQLVVLLHPVSVAVAKEKPKFQIIRKAPDVVLALSRIVYDNNHQASDLIALKQPRWSGAGPWKTEDTAFSYSGGEEGWLRYQHLIPNDKRDAVKAQLITDFMGYNTTGRANQSPPQNWVNDLMLECDVDVQNAAGEVILEVAKGYDRFQAVFDLQSGKCTLKRLQLSEDHQKEGEPKILASTPDDKPTKLKGTGTHHIRLANVDERLTLWVDDDLPFEGGLDYDPAPWPGPVKENDLDRPARIGARGATVKVEHVRLWRDTYYTAIANKSSYDKNSPATSDVELDGAQVDNVDWSEPKTWKGLRSYLRYATIYVRPEHYLCMGDNSPESSDGRTWGLVPQRLMLGRALMVYYPFRFPWWPLDNPVNRLGAIH